MPRICRILRRGEHIAIVRTSNVRVLSKCIEIAMSELQHGELNTVALSLPVGRAVLVKYRKHLSLGYAREITPNYSKNILAGDFGSGLRLHAGVAPNEKKMSRRERERASLRVDRLNSWKAG
jgi:hypothetical protein